MFNYLSECYGCCFHTWGLIYAEQTAYRWRYLKLGEHLSCISSPRIPGMYYVKRDVSLFGCGSTIAVIGVDAVIPRNQDIIAAIEPLNDQGG